MPSSSPARPARPGLREAGAAFRYRNFTVFWIGALLSNTGSWMQTITVPYVVYELTSSAAWVGFAAFMQLMPTVLTGPVAGAIADRFPRRRVLMVTQSLQACVAVALWAVWAAGLATPGVLVAIVALNGLIAGLNIPSWQAFVSELVPRSALLNAVTLNSAQFNASRALGPAVGGVVLGTLGPGAAFVANAVSYGAVLLALAMVRLPQARRAPGSLRVWSQFVEGARYTRSRRGIWTCIVMVSVLGFLGAPVFQLAPVFARDVYDVGGGLYGLLAASMGIGAVLGAPIIGAWAPTRRRSRVAAGGLAAYAVGITAFGLAPVYWLGFASLLAVGAAHLTVASVLNTTIQLLVDERMRGRAISIYLMVLTGTMPVGALVQGQLADTWGAPATATIAGLLMLAGALVVRTRTAALDAMDGPGPGFGPDADAEAAPTATGGRTAATAASAARAGRGGASATTGSGPAAPTPTAGPGGDGDTRAPRPAAAAGATRIAGARPVAGTPPAPVDGTVAAAAPADGTGSAVAPADGTGSVAAPADGTGSVAAPADGAASAPVDGNGSAPMGGPDGTPSRRSPAPDAGRPRAADS